MNHTLEKFEQYSVLTLMEEKLDSTVAPDLKSKFVEAQADGASNLIVDLSAVKYSDSSGLSALLVGNRTFGETGTMVIHGVTDHVKKLISISMIDKVLNILPTKEEAVDFIFMSSIERELSDGQDEEE